VASPAPSTAQPSILEPGRTCWRVERARRAAFLVDGERYFGAVAGALERARESVLLVGWDFHTGMRLRRSGDEPDLVTFLDLLARRREALQIRVLEWDFAMLFALERQLLPRVRFGARTHERVRFALDSRHPSGGSHHQKLVVVDDAVAFTGGFDLTACRWDTREHRADDPRRSDPGFPAYAPFHDVGIVFDGAAARALGELARERWREATGEVLPPARAAADAWPTGVEAELRDVEIGLARTLPPWDGRRACREVEALYLASIRRARRSIYVENQYLTAGSIGEALCERLREPRGPEVVIVGPECASGWLEDSTMGVLRGRLVRRMREADRYGRLAVTCAVLPGERGVNVHAKLMIVDDDLVRVGSSNLANRSMGLDSELDVAIEARGEPRVSRAIAALQDDLLAEHLGCQPAQVRAVRSRTGSLVATLRELGGGPRTLRALEDPSPHWLDEWIPDGQVLDPAEAVGVGDVVDALLPKLPADRGGRRRLLALVAVALLLVAAAGLWHFDPLARWAAPGELAASSAPLLASPIGPSLAVLGIAVASTLLFPVTPLIVTSGLLFGPWVGAPVAFVGSLLAALLGYVAGRALWREGLRSLVTPRLRRAAQRIRGAELLAVAMLRVVPVAPFGVVNLAAGAADVRPRDYLVGTAVGMAPGIVAMTLLAERLRDAVVDPGWGAACGLLALAGALLGARALLERRLERSRRREGGSRTP
jgi:phosphatidylserine/phosphatidylglycerophosphate/cardiolipin synthase-like enzyme/uncharacterized membrane protein YdjX (TVP38/TMEM64 family)